MDMEQEYIELLERLNAIREHMAYTQVDQYVLAEVRHLVNEIEAELDI